VEFAVYTDAGSNCPLPKTSIVAWLITGPTGKFQLITSAHSVNTGNANWTKINVVPNTIGVIVPNTTGVVDLSIPGIYTISVAAKGYDNVPNCFPQANTSFEIIDCCPTGKHWDAKQKKCVDCPTITTPQVQVSGTSPGGNAAIAFSTSVSPAIATSFNWKVTTPNGTVFTKTTLFPNTTDGTADGTWMSNTTTGNLDISSPGAYVVEVTATVPGISSKCAVSTNIGFNIPSGCPPGQHFDTTLGKCVSDTPMSIGCWILLVLAMAFGNVAVILAIIAWCTLNLYLAIASGVLAALALGFLIAWLALCARGNCAIFNWLRWIVIYIMMYVVPASAIITGIITKDPICGLKSAAVSGSHWGYVLLILDIAGPLIGCTLEPPPLPFPWSK
jgi:hypothetical protein